MAFKVKTTAPKLYCVRPNSGRVEPGRSVEVSVILQSMKEDPPLGAKCKDKFLIQTTLITPERESIPIGDLWTATEADDATKIHQQKLRVAYLPPEGEPIPEDALEQPSMITSEGDLSRFDTIRDTSANGHPLPQETSPSPPIPDRAASPAYLVAQEETTTTTQIHPSSPPRPAQALPTEEQAPPPAPVPVPIPAPTPAVSAPAPAPIPAPVPVLRPTTPSAGTAHTQATTSLPESDDLSTRYAEALVEIERLNHLLADVQRRAATAAQPVGVRRRTTRVVSEDGDTLAPEGSEDDEGTVVDSLVGPQSEGVPVQVVAGIAFAVFLATYLFF